MPENEIHPMEVRLGDRCSYEALASRIDYLRELSMQVINRGEHVSSYGITTPDEVLDKRIAYIENEIIARFPQSEIAQSAISFKSVEHGSGSEYRAGYAQMREQMNASLTVNGQPDSPVEQRQIVKDIAICASRELNGEHHPGDLSAERVAGMRRAIMDWSHELNSTLKNEITNFGHDLSLKDLKLQPTPQEFERSQSVGKRKEQGMGMEIS